VSVTAELKVVYRDQDEEVVKQSNFSPYTNAAVVYCKDYPAIISASTSLTVYSYSTPAGFKLFPVATDLLLVKNKGSGAVRIEYKNLNTDAVSIEVKPGKLVLVQDVDGEASIVLVNASAYNNEVDIFLAGH